MVCNAILYLNRANMSTAVTFMYEDDHDRVEVLAGFWKVYPVSCSKRTRLFGHHGD